MHKDKKVFIVARFADAEKNYVPLREELAKLGISLSHDWYEHCNGIKEDNRDPNLTENLYLDIEGIKNADLVVVFRPCGHDSMVEFGAAIALDKPIIMVFDGLQFKNLPSYSRYRGVRLFRIRAQVDSSAHIAKACVDVLADNTSDWEAGETT